MKRSSLFVLGLVIGLLSVGVAYAARNGSGSYTLPAGNPVTTGTTISSTWANNTLADLQTEMTDSLSRSGKGGMLASLRTIDGTVSSPAYSFTSETNTGFYRVASNVLGLAVNGALALNLQGTPAAPTTAISNAITPKNTPKVWATLTTNGTGTLTLTDGFGVTSATANSTDITLTFAQAFADTKYTGIAVVGSTTSASFCTMNTKATGTVKIRVWDPVTGIINPTGLSGPTIELVLFGAQ